MKFPYGISSLTKLKNRQEETDNLCFTMFNTNPAGVIISTIEEGIILEINETMLNILGFSREECVGRSIVDIGFYTNTEMRDKAVEFLIENKSIHNKEIPFFPKSRELHYGIFSAELIEFQNQPCIFASMFDITSHMDIQNSLESTTNKLETLFQSIPDMLFILDYAGNILRTNSSVGKRLGYSDESLTKMHILNIHPSSRRAEVVTMMGQILSEEITRCTIPLVTSRGEQIPVETNIVLTSWDNKDVVLSISRDITERVMMGQQQKELQRQLQQTQKMEAIGVLAGGIAHDFNNILFPITAYSELLQEEMADSSTLKAYVKEIHSAAIRAKDLVKQILTFSREVGQEVQPVQPLLVVKEAVKLIRKTLPKSINIKYQINPECKMVMADPTQIYQITMNLMINGFHAMESSGGTLTINLDNITNGEASYVKLSVSDTGIGMDELTIEKIFNPYFTTKSEDKGTGLGLSVVHGIVKLYKGMISVKSRPGEGSTFDVILPAIDYEEQQSIAIERTIINKGSERILLVDDEEMIIKPLKKMLRNLGYSVMAFTSSLEALEAFTNNPDIFDLIVTDLSLPDMSGIQLSEAILKIRPKMPVILCTGYSYSLTPEKVEELGIRALLMKPIIKSDLTCMIRQILDS